MDNRIRCINHPSDNFVVIRDWQLLFCEGNKVAAALLSFFEGWHNSKLSARIKGKQRNKIMINQGKVGSQHIDLLQNHSTEELIYGIKGIGKRNTIKAAREVLKLKKVITEHPNPYPKEYVDNSIYYLFHPKICNEYLTNVYLKDINSSINKVYYLLNSSSRCVKKGQTPITEKGQTPITEKGGTITRDTNNTRDNIKKEKEISDIFSLDVTLLDRVSKYLDDRLILKNELIDIAKESGKDFDQEQKKWAITIALRNDAEKLNADKLFLYLKGYLLKGQETAQKEYHKKVKISDLDINNLPKTGNDDTNKIIIFVVKSYNFINDNYPDLKSWMVDDLAIWRKTINDLNYHHKCPLAEIRKVMKFGLDNDFWKTKVINPNSFKNNYNSIKVQLNNTK